LAAGQARPGAVGVGVAELTDVVCEEVALPLVGIRTARRTPCCAYIVSG
jgi:hypothetical protein